MLIPLCIAVGRKMDCKSLFQAKTFVYCKNELEQLVLELYVHSAVFKLLKLKIQSAVVI